MNVNARNHVGTMLSTALLCLAVLALVAMPAGAQPALGTVYLTDGAVQTNGTWTLPLQGNCSDTSELTRPDCEALRIVAADKATCEAAPILGTWSTAVCNDVYDADSAGNAEATQADCEDEPGRFWNAGTATCSITLKGYDRNNVQCGLLGGAYVPYTSPAGVCIGKWNQPGPTSYTPNYLTSSTGDYCLRCHNSQTEYNGPRLRDVDSYLQTGHRNVVKPIQAGEFQSGHGSATPYPTDEAGNVITWGVGTTGAQITTATGTHDLYFLVNNWMAPLGRSFYNGTGTPGYGSCSRCHTTGWRTEAALNPDKYPARSFGGTLPGIALNGSLKDLNGVATAYNSASFDDWGVNCTRCHSSVVNHTGGTGPFTAPAGQPSHHNNLTVPTMPKDRNTENYGFCTDPRFVVGGNGAAAASKLACETGNGLGEIAPGAGFGTWITPCSNNSYTDKVNCELNGNTWTAPAAAACSVTGICTVNGTPDPSKTTQVACTGAANVTWNAATGSLWAAVTDIIRCEDVKHFGEANGIALYASAHFQGNFAQRGQIITSVCMNCHRSDDSGNPRQPAGGLLIGNSHGVLGPVGHAVGQAYLNSPHGEYTGTFAQIAGAKYLPAGGSPSFASEFMEHGEAANTGNGCTGCHDVHKSVLEHGAEGEHGGGAIRESCVECHVKTPDTLNHPMPEGTPLAEIEEACIACHMPEPLLHLWRINVDPSYRTFPVAAVDGNLAAPTAPDGNFNPAVWNDVDLSCGSCHGGGARQANGTIVSADATGAYLTLNTVVGFDKAAKIRIPGAGGLQEDGVTRADFHGTIRTINPAGYPANTIRLLGAPSLITGLPGRLVTQNYTENGAFYATRDFLAARAAGMHAAEDVNPFFTFTVTGQSVSVDATGATCAGGDCDEFEWEFGDGGSAIGPTATHNYTTTGTFTITLTVKFGIEEESLSKVVTVVPAKPTVSGACVFDANSWTVTVTPAVTGTNIRQVNFNWGDGTVLGVDKVAPYEAKSHKYLVPGTFMVRLKIVDNLGQSTGAVLDCAAGGTNADPVMTAYFNIAGQVLRGTLPVPNAKVLVINAAGQNAGVAYTNATGNYSIGFLKPGVYGVVATKPGLAFPLVSVTVGPSTTTTDLVAP